MKYWNLPPGQMREAVDAVRDNFTLIEDEGTVNVTNNHWVELELRVINRDAIDWFAHGNCAALALALHDLTGWPLVFAARNADPTLVPDTWMHVLVQRPDGLYLDIQGAHTHGDIEDYWRRYAAGTHFDGAITLHPAADRAAVTAITGDLDEMLAFEQAVVRDFAEHVLKEYPMADAA